MQQASLYTLLFIATSALSTGANAQNIYKCGNSYSQIPCPDGVLINTADPRTPEQKAQADAATRRDALAADALEKSRMAQEQRDLAARKASAPPRAPQGTTVKPAIKHRGTHAKHKLRRHEPEYFTALAPADKKKPMRKKTDKKG